MKIKMGATLMIVQCGLDFVVGEMDQMTEEEGDLVLQQRIPHPSKEENCIHMYMCSSNYTRTIK